MKANDLFKYFMIVEILSIVLIVVLNNVNDDLLTLYTLGFWAWIFLPCMPFFAVLVGLAFFVFGHGNVGFGVFALVIIALIFGFIKLFKLAFKKQSKLLAFVTVCCWYVFSTFLLLLMEGVGNAIASV